MALTTANSSTSPIIVGGQLTLRTIRGRNGPFTVGRLTTHLGVFEVKDAELEQYPEGTLGFAVPISEIVNRPGFGKAMRR